MLHTSSLLIGPLAGEQLILKTNLAAKLQTRYNPISDTNKLAKRSEAMTKRNVINIANFNINTYLQNREEETRKSFERTIVNERKRVDNNLLGYQLLDGEGFIYGEINNWNLQYGDTYEIANPMDWTRIHRALGKLEPYAKEPAGDGRSRMLRITLKPADERFNNFKFTYLKKLAKGERSKCRIKTVVRKEQIIVCED